MAKRRIGASSALLGSGLVCTAASAAADGEEGAGIVLRASEEALVKFQQTLDATLDNINAVMDAACLAVHEAAVASKRKIEESLERALARLQETLKTYS